MPAQVFGNNPITNLNGGINAVVTTIVVNSAANFPTTVPYTILIDSELMLVTSGAGTTTWGVTRAQEGTGAATHANNAQVTNLAVTVATVASWGAGTGGGPGYWPALGPAGLTGAVQPTRYVGATASGAPGSGTFAVGDFVIAQDGRMWICTTAGTPGVWTTPSNTRLSGAGPSIIGGAAPAVASGLFLMQAGSALPTTNNTGGFNINYPTPFPNGVLSVQLTMGDTTFADSTAVCLLANMTLSAINGIAYNSSGVGLNTVAVRINWMAIGW